MTTSLVFSSPKLWMAAADTRLNLSDPSFGVHVADGPGDFELNVESKNYKKIIPYYMRKIARIRNSWGTTAGDYLAGNIALNLLKSNRFDNPKIATNLLNLEKEEILKESRLLGFPDSASLQTRIMVAREGEETWHCLLSNPEKFESNNKTSYSMNIPTSVNAAENECLTEKWKDRIEHSLKIASISTLIKATADFIQSIHKISPCTGPRIQIGFTIKTPMGDIHHYLDGHCESVLKCPDAELPKMISTVA